MSVRIVDVSAGLDKEKTSSSPAMDPPETSRSDILIVRQFLVKLRETERLQLTTSFPTHHYRVEEVMWTPSQSQVCSQVSQNGI